MAMKKIARGVLLPIMAASIGICESKARPQEPMQPTQQDKPAVKVYNPFVKSIGVII